MATSYPSTDAVTGATLARSHFEGNAAVSTGRAGHLVDIVLTLMQRPMNFIFAEQTTSTTGASGDILMIFEVQIPDWAEDEAMSLVVPVEAKVTANDGDVWLRDATTGDTGAQQNVTQTSYADETLTLAVGSGWSDTERRIQVRGKVTNGSDTLSVKEEKVRGRFED